MSADLPAVSPDARPSVRGMVLVVAFLGACFVAIRFARGAAPPLWLATLRALIAGAVLLGYATWRGRTRPIGLSQWGVIGGLGLANATFAGGAMYLAAARLPTGIASVLANAQPLLIVLPAWLIYRERPHRGAVVGLFVGMAGLLVVGLPGGGGSGAVLAVGAAAAGTAGTLLARRLGALDNVVAAGWSFLTGAGALAVWALADEGVPHIAWTWRLIGALGFLAIPGTAVVYVVWFHEARRCPLYRLAAWTFAVPAFGLVLAVLIEGERPSAWTTTGLAIVLAALWLVLRGDKPTRPGHDPPQDPRTSDTTSEAPSRGSRPL
ncbi:MAG: DMT family transporter [Actinomycetota bacterium]|nr:DMT family transporter [Actinomycetota bacterium]